jgi:lysophospholipase L1-like esterase
MRPYYLVLAAGAALLACAYALYSQAPQPAIADPHLRMLAIDYGQLTRYAAADLALPPAAPGEQRVVFYGDSITDAWRLDQYFPGKGYINRGISGQTTPQMVVRFRQDVLNLRPRVVVLLAGTNDLAGNTGPMTLQETEDNYATMAELARLHNITMVFSSVMPVNNYIHPEMTTGRPPASILVLNTWLKAYCQANHLIYLDYYTPMLDSSGMLQKSLTLDGLHPNPAGYALMAPLAQSAVNAALLQPAAR